MKRRYLVLGFSLVLAVAVAVPALGQSSDPTATTAGGKKTAKKALKKAEKADQRSQQALNVANEALDTAKQAAGQGGQSGATRAPVSPNNLSVGQAVTVQTEGAPPDTGFRLIEVSDGFAWGLACTNENGEPVSSLVVANLTPGQDPAGNGGGNDSAIDGGLQFMNAAGNPTGDQSNSFDMGESAVVATSFNPAIEAGATPPGESPSDFIQRMGFPHRFPGPTPDDTPTGANLGPLDWGFADLLQFAGTGFTNPAVLDSGYLFTGEYPDAFSGGWVLIYGTASRGRTSGTTQAGFGGVLNNPRSGEFAGNPTCVGSLNLLAR